MRKPAAAFECRRVLQKLYGIVQGFPGYCRTGGRCVRPRRRSRDVCIHLCAIQPVKKAEFIRTVDDVSVTMLVESNMNPTSDRSGQQSGRMSRCANFRPVSESRSKSLTPDVPMSMPNNQCSILPFPAVQDTALLVQVDAYLPLH